MKGKGKEIKIAIDAVSMRTVPAECADKVAKFAADFGIVFIGAEYVPETREIVATFEDDTGTPDSNRDALICLMEESRGWIIKKRQKNRLTL